jgi:hypothetical protein
MITDTAQSRGAWTERSDRDAACREEFLTLLARLRLERALAIALVETTTGQPFEMCTAGQLVPFLQQLLELLRSSCSPVEADL